MITDKSKYKQCLMTLEMEENNSLSFHMALAKEIVEYSQHAIKIGTTELSFNEVKDKQFRRELHQNIERLRHLYHKADPFSLEVDKALRLFERRVKMILSWEIGNCLEHSYLALDFLLNETKKTRGEVCTITGGDHVFLVIGRSEKSELYNPMTWGEEAVICDPWSKKYYPAKEYLEKLRNFRWVKGTNTTEPFNPSSHTINRRSLWDTTDYLRSQEKGKSGDHSLYWHAEKKVPYMDIVLSLFQEKMTFFKEACDALYDDLISICADIKREHSESNAKYRALSICIDDLTHCSKQVGKQLEHIKTLGEISPEEASKELSKQLRSNYQLFKNARDKLDERKSILNEGRIFTLFNTSSYRKTVNALKRSHKKTNNYDQEIQNRSSRHK